MKQFYLSFLVVFFISCGPGKPKATPVKQTEANTFGDPYFKKSSDTVSVHGPRNIVRNILQDKSGKLWFATWEGIIRYDPFTKLFTNVTLKEGLVHVRAFSLLEDRSGNIWIGTTGAGVYCYNSSADTSTSHSAKSFKNLTTKDGLINNTVLCILEDKTGKIWFGTEGGVCYYDGKSFTKFILKENLSNKDIFCITEDSNGNIWFATRDDGVFVYSGKSVTSFTNNEGLPFTEARSIKEDKAGKIWIGSRDGLCCYNPLANLYAGEKKFSNVMKGFTTTIYEDRTGNLWLSAGVININEFFYSGSDEEYNRDRDDGMALYCYHVSTKPGGNANYFIKIAERSFLNDNQIFGVCEDKDGNIWFGTMNGVCRYNKSQEDNPCNIKTCRHDLKIPQDLKEHTEELNKLFTAFTE